MNNYFNDRFGFLVLFVFLIGFLGDTVIHFGTFFGLFMGLAVYYKSMNFGISGKTGKFLSWALSGIAGGLACVFALVMGQLILMAVNL